MLAPYFNPPLGSIGSIDLLLQPSQPSPLLHIDTVTSTQHTTTATTATTSNKQISITAAKNLIDTCLSTLVAGVASSDLQYLIDPSTGEVLLIDFTEAAILFPSTTPARPTTTSASAASTSVDTNTVVVPLTDYQRQLVYNFISELQAAIPSSIYSEVEPYVRQAMRVKLGAIEQYAFLFTE